MEKAGATSASGFRNRARLFGSDAPIKPGEYEVKKGMGAGDILRMMQEGRTVQRFVTVPEGMPSIMVWERLMAEPRLTGTVAVPAEGSVLPDSYAFDKGEPRAAVLKRMQAAMDKTFAELWAKRSPRTAAKDRNEAITLASIVDPAPAARELADRYGVPLYPDLDAMFAAGAPDALIIATEWALFRNPELGRVEQLLKEKTIFDGRNLYDPQRLARDVHNEEEALEIYFLSCAAIDIDHFMERSYLNALGDALKIPQDVREGIERDIREQKQALQG